MTTLPLPDSALVLVSSTNYVSSSWLADRWLRRLLLWPPLPPLSKQMVPVLIIHLPGMRLWPCFLSWGSAGPIQRTFNRFLLYAHPCNIVARGGRPSVTVTAQSHQGCIGEAQGLVGHQRRCLASL